jgi:hypothetical protein
LNLDPDPAAGFVELGGPDPDPDKGFFEKILKIHNRTPNKDFSLEEA